MSTALSPILPVGLGLVEGPDSPKYSLGERSRMVRNFSGSWTAVLAAIPSLGSVYGAWVVKEVTPEKTPGETGRLTVSYEAMQAAGPGEPGPTLPDDEFELAPVELNPRIERHPNYDGLTDAERKLVRTAVDSPEQDLSDAAWIDLGLGTAEALDLAQKLVAGQENYYLFGLNYSWSSSSWTLPLLNAGAIIEAPRGPLAAPLAVLTAAGWTWLRVADSLSYSNQIYKVVRQWKGAPNGHWAADLYG